jgi:hypothetical protein
MQMREHVSPKAVLIIALILGFFLSFSQFAIAEDPFAKIIASIGSNETTLTLSRQNNITADLVIPANITLRFNQGGSLNIADTKTVTINGHVEAGLYQIFKWTGTGKVVLNKVKEVYPQWWGAKGDGVTDDTAAIQTALDAMEIGSILIIPSGQYYISSTLTLTKNRITIQGTGLTSALYFNPTIANDNLFEQSGGLDNVIFKDFQVYNQNANGCAGVSAFWISSGASRFVWDRIYIEHFNRLGIYIDSACYLTIKNCRFLDMDNSAIASYLARAIRLSTYANDVTIAENKFSQNDNCIYIPDAGAAVRILNNSFENDGNSGNVIGITNQIYAFNIKALQIKGNYFEAERTGAANAVVEIESCPSSEVSANHFTGELGGITYTTSFLKYTTSRNPIIFANTFEEISNYFFIVGNYPLKAFNNTFIDGGSTLTDYPSVIALMSGVSYIELDLKTDFVWNPISLADGAGETSGNITITGAALGDTVQVYPPYNLQGILCMGYVSAANTVNIRLQNETGETIDLVEGTWKVKVIKY